MPTIEDLYEEYLSKINRYYYVYMEKAQCTDVPTRQVAFYSAMLEVLEKRPVPHADVQKMLIKEMVFLKNRFLEKLVDKALATIEPW